MRKRLDCEAFLSVSNYLIILRILNSVRIIDGLSEA